MDRKKCALMGILVGSAGVVYLTLRLQVQGRDSASGAHKVADTAVAHQGRDDVEHHDDIDMLVPRAQSQADQRDPDPSKNTPALHPDLSMPLELNQFLSRKDHPERTRVDLRPMRDRAYEHDRTPVEIRYDAPPNLYDGVASIKLTVRSMNVVAQMQHPDQKRPRNSPAFRALRVTEGIPASWPKTADNQGWIGTHTDYRNCAMVTVFEYTTRATATDTVEYNIDYRASGAVLVQLMTNGPPMVLERTDPDELKSSYASATHQSARRLNGRVYVRKGTVIRLRFTVHNNAHRPAVLWLNGHLTSTIPDNFAHLPAHADWKHPVRDHTCSVGEAASMLPQGTIICTPEHEYQ